MNRKWIILIGAIIVIGAILFIGSRVAQQNTQVLDPADGDVVTAFIGDLTASATASGQVQPQRQTTLSVSTPGRVEAVNVRQGDPVQAGEILLQLDTDNLALNVATAEQNLRLKEAMLAGLLEPAQEADIASAEAALASAQAALTDLMSGPTVEQVAAYEASLRSSEASVSSASANLSAAQNSVKESQIQAARAALAAAEIQQQSAIDANEDNRNEATHLQLQQANQTVADTRATLNDLLAGPDTASAASSVAAAAARLEGAEANFDIQTGAPNAAQIAAAEAQIAQAQASLETLLEGPSTPDIDIAEAEVAQARLNLEDAQDRLAKASLVAPFDGVVTAVNYSEGEIGSGPAVELVDSGSLEVILEIDEVDIGSLSLGQPAILTLEAWPEVAIESEIASIAPTASTQAGSTLVIYEVHLPLEEASLPVRVGMTANADLITAEIKDVLLVPNRAINVDRDRGTYSANLVVSTEEGIDIEEVPVTIGLRDNQFTEILSGLNEGDEVQIGAGAPVGNPFGPPADNN